MFFTTLTYRESRIKLKSFRAGLRHYSTKPPLSETDIMEHLKRLLGDKFDPRYIPTPKQVEAMMENLSENGLPSRSKIKDNTKQMQIDLAQTEAEFESLSVQLNKDNALIQEQQTIITEQKAILQEKMDLLEKNEALLKKNIAVYESNKRLVKEKQKYLELQKQLLEKARNIY